MGLSLREVLRLLCVEYSWSYAVFWRAVRFHTPMHLIWEDAYSASSEKSLDLLLKENEAVQVSANCSAELHCQAEDTVIQLVNRMMVSKAHVVGDGLVGQAALSGNHQWIVRDTLHGYSCISKGLAEISSQFVRGIQTIVIIPVLPFGVIQFGSTRMVLENIRFVNHVKCLFAELHSGSVALSSEITENDLSQKTEVFSSHGTSKSNCKMTGVCIKLDNLPNTANGCSSQLIGLADQRSIIDPCLAIPLQFNNTVLPSATEVTSSKEATKATCSIGKPILHLNCELHPSQIIVSKPGIAFLRQELPQEACYEYKNQPSFVNSILSYNGFKALEGQAVLSGTGTLLTRNPTGFASDNPGKSQIESHRCNLATSVKDVKTVLLVAGNESSSNADNLRNAGCVPGGTCEDMGSSYTDLSITGVPQMLKKPNYLYSSLHAPGVSEEETMSNLGMQREENILVQASHVSSSQSDVSGLCSGLAPGTLESNRYSSPSLVKEDYRYDNVACEAENNCTAENRQNVQEVNEYKCLHALANDLHDVLGLDNKTKLSGNLDDVLVHRNTANTFRVGSGIPYLTTYSDVYPVLDLSNGDISVSAIPSVADYDQLLDAVISNVPVGAKQESDDSLSCRTSLTDFYTSHASPSRGQVDLLENGKDVKDKYLGLPMSVVKMEGESSSYTKSSCSFMESEYFHQSEVHKSQIQLCVESGQHIKYDNMSASNGKKVAEVGKLNRKRPRPGESPRPRPKDRQMIQERIKELREIIPNGAKCSIDALLEKTIKHMLFLQSVKEHKDKLKDMGKSKISDKDVSLILKDNFESGATWAFEVGSKSMVCPIIAEDLNSPRQMLLEMLSEDRGFFPEIADLIKGLGLTILKGVMEARKNKVWGRFIVEANRDMTRMETFLSLVHMFGPTAGSRLPLSSAHNLNMPHTMFHQTSIHATGSSDLRLK